MEAHGDRARLTIASRVRRPRATAAVLLAALSGVLAPGVAGADDPAPVAPPAAPPEASPAAPPPTPDEFSALESVPTLRLRISPDDLAKLRAAPRTYVHADLCEGDRTACADVALKLKGGAGSFREVDDRPALTVLIDRFRKDQRFHGLDKLHLNNSIQDDSCLNEALCAELFAAAGYPAPRVAHARVFLGDRDLGLYVLKEGVDPRFLARALSESKGNLYDGGFCTDVDGELEKDAGKGPDDRSDLAALVAACREPDLPVRAQRLAALLDVEAFLTFTALERMTCHWDGYSLNANNYRVYVRTSDGRALFLPHGMDQMFQDPGASVLDMPTALVADAVLSVPEWRRRYRERLVALLPLFDAEKGLLPRVRRMDALLRPAFAAMGAEAVAAHAEAVHDLEARLKARSSSLRDQVTRPDPPALAFDAEGKAFVTGWQPRIEEGEPVLEQVDHAGRRAFGIVVGKDGACIASWRRRVVLEKGRYALEAVAAVAGVTPRLDPSGAGAGLRMSGGQRQGGLSGSSGWKPASFEFEVTETLRSVELVAELRATKGKAWFVVDSLRLVRR